MNADTKERYGTVSRLFHWGVALLVGWQLLKVFDRIDDGEHWVGQVLVPWHVSIGSLILLVMVFRIFWAARQRDNRPVAPPPPLMAFLARAGHFLLYAGLILMPLTGISILIGEGYGLTVFGVELVPGGAKIPWLSDLGGALHSPVAWLLMLMIAGHAGMAFVHHFVRRDGVLRRMI